MPAFLNLAAIAVLAVFTLSSAPVPANALVADRAQVARHVHARDAVIRRKRSAATCLPSPSSLPSPPSSPSPSPSPSPTASPSPSATPSSFAPSATPTSSAPAGNTSKKWGLAFNTDPEYLQNFAFPKVGYLYNWSPTLPSGIPSGIVGIPQFWGSNQESPFTSVVGQSSFQYVLGMNEPNEPSQSNLLPADGYGLWMQFIAPLRSKGTYLISPACTDDDAGKSWYNDFFNMCNNDPHCHVDAIAFHAYNTKAQDVIDYATFLYNTYKKPIWITEFADQNFSGTGDQASRDEVWAFAQAIADFVNNTDWIVAAFPFGIVSDLQGVNTDNALMNPDGTATDLAKFYFGG